LLRAIGELPEDEREVLELARLQEMTQAQAAHVLGV
jgi:DNA-directed RNA polymerase specialized sigma24 family protein